MKLLILFLIISLSSCSVPKKLKKTNIGNDLYDFKKYNNLNEYTERYRYYIKDVRCDITNIEMERLAPLTMVKKDKKCLKTEGFVLIHGLSDSPFSMQDLANSILEHNKCAVINIPILPGNALNPGASLEATYKDWIASVNLAITDLQNKKVDSISLIGFSTGGALALYNVLTKADIISKVVLISPAIDLDLAWYKSSALHILNFIGNINNNLAYLVKLPDYNPYKYGSFSVNGIYQLNKLINKNKKLLKKAKQITTPLFIAASLEDSTINTNTTLKFIENDKFSGLILGVIYTKNISAGTDKMPWIPVEDLNNKIIDLSHMSVATSPQNPVFGKNASINYGCSHYQKNSPEIFNKCRSLDKDFYYGEINASNLKKYPKLSRIYYNPQYNKLFNKIAAFLE